MTIDNITDHDIILAWDPDDGWFFHDPADGSTGELSAKEEHQWKAAEKEFRRTYPSVAFRFAGE